MQINRVCHIDSFVLDLAGAYKESYENVNATSENVTDLYNLAQTLNERVEGLLLFDITRLGSNIDIMMSQIINMSDVFNTTQVCSK